MDEMTEGLSLTGIRAGYGRVEVLHGIELKVPPGSVVALLGPNGAGKTTLLRVASGRLTPSAGRVGIDGLDVTGASSDALVRRGVCCVPEGRGIFPTLTVAENLRMWSYGPTSYRYGELVETALTRFPVLAKKLKQRAGTLSGGEQQMLAMSRGLTTNPRYLLLDEISMGLAPLIVGTLYDEVARLAGEGLSILVVEQFAETALAIADHAAVLVGGSLAYEGSPSEVREAIADLYLAAPAQDDPLWASQRRDTVQCIDHLGAS